MLPSSHLVALYSFCYQVGLVYVSETQATVQVSTDQQAIEMSSIELPLVLEIFGCHLPSDPILQELRLRRVSLDSHATNLS